jgi:magnesium chelatase subunit I|mmetsp:Transcript_3909/g.8818  ORF Transcript_3909/g.8818 Transcript_3909/m.8818 type:complete len:352 (-) Transcript_3909:218-1273(-)|eukprot:CAMPEP_0173168644 /NCGR_PEP_ID=MMETSP1141-20130122/264_1 /TAXON_ID=483371 /ORGANISM="non described non described, Strain CCMP2298" /LENGTH=351 /DNA_ID=CAMNT_0014090385 /DNA_START=167 /DNA_END=1222 /DNA_ORIENTATION=+
MATIEIPKKVEIPKKTLKNLTNFPFAAIVGQEEMKLALQLNVIDPSIGGVMIMGDRGTGKSTTIRALADLLPNISVIKNDPFNTNPEIVEESEYETEDIQIPMVELPLGATEDRVCGTINLKEILSGGKNSFEPGLLARANRGLLYVDEINLLDDHLVDVLLDSAASGWNTVEREGISIKHPARFILIGSGNPEEGELRPQLLDRFGMHAEIGTIREPELRVRIVEERISFDKAPQFWFSKYEDQQLAIQDKMLSAQKRLPDVLISPTFQLQISQICSDLGVEGLRGDIVSTRAAKALTAFEGRTEVTLEDIRRTIILCLRHRLRRDPMESINSGEKIQMAFEKIFMNKEI